MSFIGLFFLAVLVLSTSELFLLVRVAAEVGFGVTALLCIATGVGGGALVRRQGLALLADLQRQLAAGVLPADELLHGVILIVVGALLCVPGFITDAFGFLLLVPPLRRLAVAWLRRRVRLRVGPLGGPFPFGGPAGPAGAGGEVVRDVTCEVREEPFGEGRERGGAPGA
jgi:UPF0716 protein FxsA